jgi:Stage II sporulation protein E (SpoIIE)
MVEPRATGGGVPGYVGGRVRSWRTGSRESQVYVLVVLLLGITGSFVVSLAAPTWMPLAAYFVWLLVAMLLLRFGMLLVAVGWNSVAAVVMQLAQGSLTSQRAVALALYVVAAALVVYQASRQRSGLPVPLSEALLTDLRDRLQRQGRVPDLPGGWHSQTAMIASHGVHYAGDFLVADLSDDGQHLEVILVDVCGKGISAGPAALQFAGALGGLIGALPPVDLFRAANDFLLRQREDEQFATAVHLIVDLEEGTYEITSAGHPPALRYDLPTDEWLIDNARGTALGVLKNPELHRTAGRLFPGEALMFYTDGVVESRTTHLDVGIAWLQRIARDAVSGGFPGAANRVIRQVDRGDDDRAVLILSRDAVAKPLITPGDVSTARG